MSLFPISWRLLAVVSALWSATLAVAAPLVSFRQANDEMVFLSADPQDHESLAHVLSRRRALAPPHALGIAPTDAPMPQPLSRT